MHQLNANLEQRSVELEGVLNELRVEVEERKKVELELRQAQKLEAVGRLAAGIAHEINTPIQYVGDSLYFLESCLSSAFALIQTYEAALSEEQRAALEEARDLADIEYQQQEGPEAVSRAHEGIRRVADIVKAMKTFAHPERAKKDAMDLNEALRSTLTVTRNEYKYVADVEVELGEVPPVVCHLSSLNQVFLNLIVNAAQAIEDSGGPSTKSRGTIRVKSYCEGDEAIVEISDTGGGIPEDIQTRIFEPFFTTKEVGRGTGQGLAIARNIVVEQHGGSLTFESIVGRGTTFYIRLPLDLSRSSEAAA